MRTIRNRTVTLTALALLAGLCIGLAWWAISIRSTVDAAAQLSAACVQTQSQQSFDFRSTITAPITELDWNGSDWVDRTTLRTYVFDARVSGDDFYLSATEDGEPLGEAIIVGGAAYERIPGGQWVAASQETSQSGTRIVNMLLNNGRYDEVGSPLCPTTGVTVRRVGDVQMDGATVQQFRTQVSATSAEVADAVPNSTLSATWDYWVGSDNLLRQTRQTSIQTLATGETRTHTTLTTISGVGEANVITAPTIS